MCQWGLALDKIAIPVVNRRLRSKPPGGGVNECYRDFATPTLSASDLSHRSNDLGCAKRTLYHIFREVGHDAFTTAACNRHSVPRAVHMR
jgi:hypothetical protein